MSLTKADKLLIIVLMILSVGCIFPLLHHAPSGDTASVYVKEDKVLSIDLRQDGTYQVQGAKGDVIIEVKNHAIRVRQENSPHHLCSKQGFVSQGNMPIVCLPNETVVQIDEKTQEDTVIR